MTFYPGRWRLAWDGAVGVVQRIHAGLGWLGLAWARAHAWCGRQWGRLKQQPSTVGRPSSDGRQNSKEGSDE